MKGFTLIEVAVVIALSAIILVPSVTMLANIQLATVESDRTLRATSIAQSVMERFVKNAAQPVSTPSTPADADFNYRIVIAPSPLPIPLPATVTAQVDVLIPGSNTPYCSLVTVVRRQK